MKITESQARDLLNNGFTCVLYGENEVLKSTERGVAPLIQWLESGQDFHGFSAADKVVGKAAAFLYVLLGVEKVYAVVLSESAEKVFRQFQIEYDYGQKTPMIRNRANTGFCPMEQAVWEIDEPQSARMRIEETLVELGRRK